MPRRLLGERVYTVFAGLFEGFRLHDLYVPEKGGVLVCTEVLHLLARRRLPKLAAHFDAIDFSLDMVRKTAEKALPFFFPGRLSCSWRCTVRQETVST